MKIAYGYMVSVTSRRVVFLNWTERKVVGVRNTCRIGKREEVCVCVCVNRWSKRRWMIEPECP